MKTNGLLLLFGLLIPLYAQDAVVQQPSKSATEVTREERKLPARKKPAEDILKQKPAYTYGGFLTEVKRSENKSKLLSLRQPVDPRNDYKHVLYDMSTGRPRGVVLFSLDF
jgi:hypothetical protein